MKAKRIAWIAIMAAVTAVCSQVSIPIPFTTIPFTLSLLAVFLCGALLSPLDSLFAQAVYLLIGAVGVPVFHSFTGGLGVLFGPTGGYLMAYLVMAPIIAISAKKFRIHLFPALIVGMLISLLLCYLIGTGWFMIVSGYGLIPALTSCVFPFIIPDVIKIIIAAFFAVALRKALTKAHLYEA